MYKKVELPDGYVGMEKNVAKFWKKTRVNFFSPRSPRLAVIEKDSIFWEIWGFL